MGEEDDAARIVSVAGEGGDVAASEFFLLQDLGPEIPVLIDEFTGCRGDY